MTTPFTFHLNFRKILATFRWKIVFSGQVPTSWIFPHPLQWFPSRIMFTPVPCIPPLPILLLKGSSRKETLCWQFKLLLQKEDGPYSCSPDSDYFKRRERVRIIKQLLPCLYSSPTTSPFRKPIQSQTAAPNPPWMMSGQKPCTGSKEVCHQQAELNLLESH